MATKTCGRRITEKDWTGHWTRLCRRPATHEQSDGLPLCERHYNKLQKKIKRAVTLPGKDGES